MSSCGFGFIRTSVPKVRSVTSTRVLDMTDPREVASLALKVARADAIHNYAALEQSLSSLLARLLKISNDDAGVIFFNIISSRSRDSILERLIEKHIAPEFWPFFNGIAGAPGVKKTPGLFALLQQLSATRNFIVHWAVAVNVGDSPVTESLVPPNVWGFIHDQRTLTVEDLKEFSARANFVSRAINVATLALFDPRFPAPEAWHQILRQPCVYPPAEGHPLTPRPRAQPPQPQSSEG